jgi:hypothetical protein
MIIFLQKKRLRRKFLKLLKNRRNLNGALGVVYPSVRRRGGTCLACFRPALVANVRKGATYRFVWQGRPRPAITVA